ncbi:MAG: nuclear transport factor 2 family protein, partial [Xanthomonadales bacterium]|nr:nuclear transport factor 2 family protein [Xanthomonadales bacterium]
MSEANRELISRLYVALDRKDGESMARCYHTQASFRDPVFSLEGEAIGDMWRMLTARASDLRAESHEVVA